MKVIIAGSRNIREYRLVEEAISESGFPITEVVSGMARGVDTMGEAWAHSHYCHIKEFRAHWAAEGRSAGILRNKRMGDYADALIAIWDGKSAGTKHMIDYANKRGLKVFVKLV